ncbi:TIGR01212 family radical SAM protein [Anaerotalea alkaliphila]|uniref:TIGR01212 family radical SAM protein n=1 Tax=Anaerotalea alkaliphila TaxID=2662126 RepID=A0A7X5HWL6_9FIRM|nr:TIGR01212 family radical SAM protein [Anaerotalea alkaliphila]NDL67941.1 TIGR01212 family radical SAM protein [Anaerotalea alkaliphila]
MDSVYSTYSDYLLGKYKGKVYKLPVDIRTTCPNRDGTLGTGGCHFCSPLGTSFEGDGKELGVKEQLERNKEKIKKKYKATKFIAYFQNYTNTYLPLETFAQVIRDACQEDIVEIAVSTRPDCVLRTHLDILQSCSKEFAVDISLELGLQTANGKTLEAVNRGHTVEDFVRAVELIHSYGFSVCTHLILNLPGDTREDVLASAALMNRLGMEQVKLHSLYVAKGTVFADLYERNELEICSMEEYKERVILFLEHLNPDIVVQRLLGRAPEGDSLFCNWNTSWWKIKDSIEAMMVERGSRQGKALVDQEASL